MNGTIPSLSPQWLSISPQVFLEELWEQFVVLSHIQVLKKKKAIQD